MEGMKDMFDPSKDPELPNSDRLKPLARQDVSEAEFREAARSLALFSEDSEMRDFDEQNPAELEHGSVSSEQYLNMRKILTCAGRA